MTLREYRRTGLAAAPIFLAAAIAATPADAVPFSSAIEINAFFEFLDDNADVFEVSIGSTNVLTTGGVATTTTIADGSVTAGPNPLAGALTDIGDSLAFATSASTNANPNGIPIEWDNYNNDLALEISNISANDSYRVVITVAYSNFVDADGLVPADDDGAFAASQFSVSRAGLGEILFSDLVSDTLFGDEADGLSQGTFGAPQSDAGSVDLTFIILPGETVSLAGTFDTQGTAFDPDTAAFLVFSGLLRVSEVTNLTVTPVAVPGAIPLMAAGLLFAFGLTRWRRGR